jgi:hypothetical protein
MKSLLWFDQGFHRSTQMDETVRKISADDIDPRFNWGRALPALGITGVDFEERVDYRRLHRYRLSRVRQALESSDLGALLVFDVNNIRYIPATATPSCGISARPPCTTSSTRHGCIRRTARPG